MSAARSIEHRFFTVMSIAVSGVILAGFTSSYGARLRADPHAVPTVIHVHAAVFFAWLLVFVAQTLLAARGKLSAHRRLGAAGAVLAAVMLLVGAAAAISAARAGHRGLVGAEFPTPEGFMLFSFAAVLAFFTLTAAALWLRASPQAHKRLMLLALSGALLPPGLSRLPWVNSHLDAGTALWSLFVLAGPVFDLVTLRRVHPAWLWGAIPLATTFPPLSAWLAQTHVGLAIAQLFVG